MTTTAKDAAAIVAAVLVVFAAAITDNSITTAEAVNMAIAFVTAGAVWLARNGEVGTPVFRRYLRGILAFTGAALALLASVLSDGVTLSEWTQIVLAGLGAIGVVAFTDGQSPLPEAPLVDLWIGVDEGGGRHVSTDPVDDPAHTSPAAVDDVTFRPGAVRRVNGV